MERITSGMANLDRLMGDGLPLVPDIVVSGSKEDIYLFSRHLLWNRVNAGGLCVYGTVSRTREEVLDDLVSKGMDVSPFLKAGTLRIVDYSSLTDIEPGTPEEKLDALYSIDKEDLIPERVYQVLAQAFHALRGVKPHQKFLAILDSVDSLAMLIGLEGTLRFEEMMFKLLKDANYLGVGLLCNEFLSEEILEAVRTKASVFIELGQGRDGKQMFRITKNIYVDWTPLF